MNERQHFLMDQARAKKTRKLLNYVNKPEAITNRKAQEAAIAGVAPEVYPDPPDDSPPLDS